MALFSTKPGVKPTDMGTSIKSNDAIGSGSRPTPSKIKIMTSEPENPHTLGRDVAGSLK